MEGWGRTRSKKTSGEEPEEGQCARCRKAKGKARVGKGEVVHCVACCRIREGSHIGGEQYQVVIGALGKHST